MAILPKAMYMFNAMNIKFSMTFCPDIEKAIVKYIWKHKRLQIAKIILIKMRSMSFTVYQNQFKVDQRP
jgi:hypothetical protein